MLNFNNIIALITECIKKNSFKWSTIATKAFKEINKRLCEALILALIDFDKVFEVEYDASEVGIRAVLTQAKRFIAYFSEKLNESKKGTPPMIRNFMLFLGL